MPDVKCTEPGCPLWISDPCVKLSGLMQIRADLEKLKPDGAGQQVALINQLLDEHLGIKDPEQTYTSFLQSNRGALARVRVIPAPPKLFTLVCANNHRRQYSISCP